MMDNLKDVVLGDEIGVVRVLPRDGRVFRVTRVTRTQIEANGCRYSRKTGRIIGSYIQQHLVYPVTDALRKAEAAYQRRQRIWQAASLLLEHYQSIEAGASGVLSPEQEDMILAVVSSVGR